MALPDDRGLIVAGGGHVGLALALAVRVAAPSISIAVADAAIPKGPGSDLRASTIAAASRRMLEQIGVWPLIEAEAQPVTDMVIGDTRPEDVGRPVFLTFGGSVGEGEAFAHLVPNEALMNAFRRRSAELGIEIRSPAQVRNFEAERENVRADLAAAGGAEPEHLRGALLVACDGARSRLRDLAGISTVGWDYGQSGIVFTVEHERPHGGRARQDFLPAGPFAVLPLTGNRSSLVWTDRTETAERLKRADPLVFQAELELRFGHELGWVRPIGPVEAFPLRLQLARHYVARRFALAGDAAHVVHPIAGQGLNLGLQDAAALAEVIVDAARLGLDIGSDEVLRRYQAWRRADAVLMGLVTDGLNRLFSNRSAPLRLARDIGLGMIDRVPRLKDAFIGRAAGLAANSPKLLRGLAI